MRCQICDKKQGTITTQEKRYFLGDGKVCNSCFDKLASGNYEELDKLAIEKIIINKEIK